MIDDLLGDRSGDDSPWRRGADVDFVHRERAAFETRRETSPFTTGPRAVSSLGVAPGPSPESAGPVSPDLTRAQKSDGQRRSAGWAAGAVAGAVLAAAIGVVLVDGDAPVGDLAARDDLDTVLAPVVRAAAATPIPVSSPCVDRRLPESLVSRWAVGIDGDVVGDLVAGADHLAIVTEDAGGVLRLALLDAVDGAEAWSTEATPGTRLVGLTDDVALSATLADGPTGSAYEVTARRVGDGTVAWTRRLSAGATFRFAANQAGLVVDDPAAGPDDIGFTSVIDVESGAIESSNVGRLLSFDQDGRLVTLAGDKVLAKWGHPSSSSLLGVRKTGAPVTVLGSTVLSASDRPGALVLSRREAPMGTRTEDVEVVPPDGFDELGVVDSLTAVGDDAVVLTSNGFLVGAELVDDRVEGRWVVEGVLLGEVANDRGRSLLVSSDGGATQSLLDAATGREVVTTATANGGVGVEDLFANGSLVRGGAGSAPTVTAYDLDGEVMWRLGPPADVAIGNGVGFTRFRQVGTATSPPSISTGVQAFGEPTPRCASRQDGEPSSR
ncbi:MAG: hypothetical protein AB8G26_05295 [Ilumatobacter sp.]